MFYHLKPTYLESENYIELYLILLNELDQDSFYFIGTLGCESFG